MLRTRGSSYLSRPTAMLVATLLLCHAAAAWQPPLASPPQHHAALASASARPRRGAVAKMSIGDDVPPEVIEAEANATPNRKFRLAGAGVGFGVSLVSAGLSVVALGGQSGLDDLVLFGNPLISLFVDIVIGGSCAWAWQQEQQTKEQNIERIWAEVKRRRSGGAASGANRAQRRGASKQQQQVRQAGAGGFASAPPPPPQFLYKDTPPPPPPPPPEASAPPAEQAGGLGGLFDGITGGVRDMFEEANAMGKASAYDLNSKLEDAGVLPPIEQTSGPGGGESGGAPQAAEEAVPPATSGSDGGGAVSAAPTSSGAASSKGKRAQGKGGKKAKRKRRK